MSNIIDSIQLSGTVYTLSAQTSGGNPTIELTQAQYDALVTAGTVQADTYYIITDASAGDLTQYWTSAQTQSAITQATSGLQVTLTAGTGIDITDNVISATGGGSITIDPSLDTGSTNAVANSAITTAIDAKADTTAVTEISDSLSGYVTTNTDQDITGTKTFVGNKKISFRQSTDSNKLGFTLYNSASTNNELATFEFRPDTYTDSSSVKHPLLYIGHYRNTNTANAGVVQTMVGFRQYDQSGGAAYHYLMPLPAEAKTPFSLTTSFQDFYMPLGFKNGSTMIKADNTGVADFSDVLGGLKLVKLTQSEYDNLATKDNSTLYVIVN